MKVDTSFIEKILSPHLLHLEKIFKELNYINTSIGNIDTALKRKEYIYFIDSKIEKTNDEIIEIKNIINFSIPQVESRINLGYSILKKNNQLLY